jgi:hypothetical protein
MQERRYTDRPEYATSAHEPCEARISFLARQLAEVLESTHDLRRERNIAREQVRNLRASVRRLLGVT